VTDLSEQAAALREPPHSIEAEQGVLGCLLLESAGFGRVAEVVTAGDFFRHENGLIFGAIEAIVRRAEPVDVITVYEQLEGEVIDFGGIAYLNALAQSVPSAANARRYAEIVAEHATLRSIIANADTTAARAFAPHARAAAVLDVAKAEIFRIEQQRGVQCRRIPLLTPPQLQESAQAVRWLAKHVIPAESLGMLYGASGTFKSFIALDCALHVVHGLPWLGRKTAQGAVVYIAAEGGSGLWSRVHAWHRTRNLRWQDAPFYVVPAAIDLRADAWRIVEAAQALGISPALVVVDTLSQTFSGEENSANEMAAYLRELGLRFRQIWSCAVLLVHHTGHNATERPRGSSAIRANLDFLFGVFRDEKEMLATMTCEKQKDGDLFDDATFSLTVHTLGTDEDGDKVTSLVARHLTRAEDVQDAMESERDAGRGGKNQLLLRLVQNGMKEAGLRKAFYEDCAIETPEGRRQAYHRARKWAVKQGFIDIAEGFVISLRKEVRA
jgi:KaiC/GvpD/RAD55 family RecA-like ATPase